MVALKNKMAFDNFELSQKIAQLTKLKESLLIDNQQLRAEKEAIALKDSEQQAKHNQVCLSVC